MKLMILIIPVSGTGCFPVKFANSTQVAVMEYYEAQKEEALRKATDFRKNRIPKYLSYFERNLKGNESSGKGKYLVGEKLSYADTVI